MKLATEKFQKFLRNHRVFHTGELEEYCAVSGYHSRNLLAKYLRQKKIKKIRNSLYSSLPGQESKDGFMPPDLLMAAKLTPDAVLGYRSALAFYGMSRNVRTGHTFITRHRIKPYAVAGTTFKPCLPVKTLQRNQDFGVSNAEIWNTPIRVVCKERLLVDSLDRLDLSGGWEEVVNAFQQEDALNYASVIEYLQILSHPATAARVGFFLEKFQSSMNVPEEVLQKLEKMKPNNPEHFFRNNRKGKFVKRWNLYVPQELMQTPSEETYEF